MFSSHRIRVGTSDDGGMRGFRSDRHAQFGELLSSNTDVVDKFFWACGVASRRRPTIIACHGPEPFILRVRGKSGFCAPAFFAADAMFVVVRDEAGNEIGSINLGRQNTTGNGHTLKVKRGKRLGMDWLPWDTIPDGTVLTFVFTDDLDGYRAAVAETKPAERKETGSVRTVTKFVPEGVSKSDVSAAFDASSRVVSADKLVGVIRSEAVRLGGKWPRRGLAVDAEYTLHSRTAWDLFLAWSQVDSGVYVEDRRDCDDFAKFLWAQASFVFGAHGLCLVYDDDVPERGSHAFNLLITFDATPGHRLYAAIIEPQTDRVAKVGDFLGAAHDSFRYSLENWEIFV